MVILRLKILNFYTKITKKLFVEKQNYEIFAIDCTQIKDLNNLCVRPTIACKQAIVEISPLHSASLRFGRNDV